MSLSELLARTKNVAAYRSQHVDPAENPDGEETHARYGVHLVERGRLQIRRGRETADLTAGSAFVARPGDTHRYLHPGGCASDVCLSVEYTWKSELDEGRDAVASAARFATITTNRLRYLHRRFEALRVYADAFLMEEWALELSAAAVSGSQGTRSYRGSSIEWYQKRIDDARDLLSTHSSEPISFVDVAHRVGMSPYHFSRIFRELVGLPPHRFLMRVRLNKAVALLKEGSTVTTACFDVGFQNLSHFVHIFKARFGTTPSKVGAHRSLRH